MSEFCRQNGLTAPQRSPSVRFEQKRRLIDRLRVEQRGKDEPVFVGTSFYEGGLIGEEYARTLMEELYAEGVLVKDADGKYALTGYKNGKFDFSI